MASGFVLIAVLLAAVAAWLCAQALASGWAHKPMALDDTWADRLRGERLAAAGTA